MTALIAYKVSLDKLHKHLLTVECTIQRPNENGQRISLPSWVPGSYLIRDFAKNIVSITAHAGNTKIAMHKIYKNTWQCAACAGPLTIRYLVYCFDPTARGAYVDNTRAFFDGCRVFIVAEGEEEQTSSVKIMRPEFAALANWRCATSMMRRDVAEDGFGVYEANNHLELIDHPFEISPFQSFDFMVANVPHTLVVTGVVQADLPRLVQDVQLICNAQMDFFGELPTMDRYVFILSVLAKGWGGIEHRASCSLICTRSSLPKMNDPSMHEEYKSLLGLFSHEYFHLWNVKRIKPEVFINPNLNSEVYTRQLWIFEGITAYFDNLNLVRAKLFSPQDYLKVLQSDLNSYLQTPGTYLQTLEESSFDAWIKYYQPDENSINSAVSYYLKGSLVALLLDLHIITNSRRKQSLADVMQVLWQQYGKPGLGLPEHYFEHVVYEVTGEDYSAFFANTVQSTEPLEFANLLSKMGITYHSKDLGVMDSLGIKHVVEQGKVAVRAVLSNSIAEDAGLAPNDHIIAINNFAVTAGNMEEVISWYKTNDLLRVHVFRNEVLLELVMIKPEQIKCSCELELVADVSEIQLLNRQKWLGTVA